MNHIVIGPQMNFFSNSQSCQQSNQFDFEHNHPRNSNPYQNPRKIETDDLKSIAKNLSGDLKPLCKELGIDEEYLVEWEKMDQKKYSTGERLLFLWIQRNNEVNY